eukprot:31316-Pelagococcus_subviridis.AAC.17
MCDAGLFALSLARVIRVTLGVTMLLFSLSCIGGVVVTGIGAADFATDCQSRPFAVLFFTELAASARVLRKFPSSGDAAASGSRPMDDRRRIAACFASTLARSFEKLICPAAAVISLRRVCAGVVAAAARSTPPTASSNAAAASASKSRGRIPRSHIARPNALARAFSFVTASSSSSTWSLCTFSVAFTFCVCTSSARLSMKTTSSRRRSASAAVSSAIVCAALARSQRSMNILFFSIAFPRSAWSRDSLARFSSRFCRSWSFSISSMFESPSTSPFAAASSSACARFKLVTASSIVFACDASAASSFSSRCRTAALSAFTSAVICASFISRDVTVLDSVVIFFSASLTATCISPRKKRLSRVVRGV